MRNPVNNPLNQLIHAANLGFLSTHSHFLFKYVLSQFILLK